MRANRPQRRRRDANTAKERNMGRIPSSTPDGPMSTPKNSDEVGAIAAQTQLLNCDNSGCKPEDKT